MPLVSLRVGWSRIRLLHCSCHESHSFLELRSVVVTLRHLLRCCMRGAWRWSHGGQPGSTLEVVVPRDICLMSLDSSIHLLLRQLPILCKFGVEDMTYSLFDSIQENLIQKHVQLILRDGALSVLGETLHCSWDSDEEISNLLCRALPIFTSSLYKGQVMPLLGSRGGGRTF